MATCRPRGKHVSAAREWRRTDTGVRTGASAVVSAHPSSKGGGAHSALPSRLGPDHHYVKLRKRCKIFLLFTPRTGSGEQLISWHSSCVFSRNGIAPYRELRFSSIEIMLKVFTRSTESMRPNNRVYGSRQQPYFLNVFICEHIYNTSVVDLVNLLFPGTESLCMRSESRERRRPGWTEDNIGWQYLCGHS